MQAATVSARRQEEPTLAALPSSRGSCRSAGTRERGSAGATARACRGREAEGRASRSRSDQARCQRPRTRPSHVPAAARATAARRVRRQGCRYPIQPASPRRSKMRPSSKVPADQEQHAFNGEGRRDIGGSPIDGRIAVPQEGPSDEDPEDREEKREPPCRAFRPPRDEQDDDEAGGKREQLAEARAPHCAVRTSASRRAAKRAGSPPAGRSTTPTSKSPHVGRDALPHGRVRHGSGRQPRGFRAHGRRGWSPESRR